MTKLKLLGIETRNSFCPLHLQPALRKMGFYKKEKLPVAEYLSKNGFYLPSGLALTLKQQNFVIKQVNKVI